MRERTGITTEDFKAVLEKHMTPDMDLDRNGRMDWFFNQYVYGTALPNYQFTHSFETDANGDVVLSYELTQGNVNPAFRMLMPIYLELADGRVINLGHVAIAGSNTLKEKTSLKGLKNKPRRAIVNYYNDVLATIN